MKVYLLATQIHSDVMWCSRGSIPELAGICRLTPDLTFTSKTRSGTGPRRVPLTHSAVPNFSNITVKPGLLGKTVKTGKQSLNCRRWAAEHERRLCFHKTRGKSHVTPALVRGSTPAGASPSDSKMAGKVQNRLNVNVRKC